MNDPKLLRKEPEKARKGLRDRGGRYLPMLERYIEEEKRLRGLLSSVEEMRARRNEASKAIGKAKASGDEAGAKALISEISELKAAMPEKEEELALCEGTVRDLLLGIPNLPHSSVPVGRTEEDNIERRVGKAPAAAGFEAVDHALAGEKLGILDFTTAAKISGSRFAILQGAGARLHRAIAQFMLDFHVERHGYREMWVPYIVRPEVCEGTGQLPKFEADLYRTGQLVEEDGKMDRSDASYLIPTAEVPLTNLVRESILDEAALPLQVTALTPCFRQEAGSYGKDVRGLIRQHQFEKVELVWVTCPEDSMETLEKLTGHAEAVLAELGLPHRVIELCTGDIGFSACRTYDLEVWFPSEKRWREVSSCSNCWDFQARRMNARLRRGPKSAPEFVHTLNGSGVAVGRIFAAILENFQNADGSVTVPEPLRPYFKADAIRPLS